MKLLTKENLAKLLMFFIIIQPILDIYILFQDNVINFIGFSPSTIIRVVTIAFLLLSLLFIIKLNKKHWYLLYGIFILIYVILHHINAINLTSYHEGNFYYNIIDEIFYIIRMLLPLSIIFITYHLPLSDNNIRKIISWLVLLISGSIVITNILGISLASYESGIIKDNIFSWFSDGYKNYDYLSLASKGFFLSANRISALLVLITPILFSNFIKKPTKFLTLLIFIQLIAMFMLGTKVATLGFIVLAITTLFLYYFFIIIKKQKFAKYVNFILIVSVLSSIALYPFSPSYNRSHIDNNMYDNYDNDINGLKTKLQKQEKELEKDLANLFIDSGDIKNISEFNLEMINHVYKGKYNVDRTNVDNILINYIKNNYELYKINKHFILKSYNFEKDPYFWYTIMKLPLRDRVNYRNLETRMLERVKEINNNTYDDLFGITFTRMSNIFDLERDFLSHYYTLGIIGILLLLSPYIIILLIIGFKFLTDKRKFNIENALYILGICITLFAAFYSGNVLDGLVVTIILGLIYGTLLKKIFYKEINKNYKFTIITPTYNDAESILETLDSIKNQTYQNFEHIIMNDGSNDNTKEVVENYIKENNIKNTIYLEQKNADQLNAIINCMDYIDGDFVYILHSDDLFASNKTLEEVNIYLSNNDVDGIMSDLILIDDKSKIIGKQEVLEYKKKKYIPPLQLLWLGRNLYVDFAFHKKEIFIKNVYNNYLLWNTPFWLNIDSKSQVNYQKVDFPFFKYRVFEGNYINNEIGKLNVINGEIRTLINLMKHYTIPFYKIQYKIFRIFNKLKLQYIPIYFNKETKNKDEIIDFVIKKRFNDYKNPYLKALYNFYHNKNDRCIKLNLDNITLYYGKDMRFFNKNMVNKTLDTKYIEIFKEMNKGFNKIKVKDKDYDTAKVLLKFLCIDKDVEIIKESSIPKTIHYVWVGGSDKPKDIKRCMKTWKKHLKDYKIIEWNESNFDINSHPFVKKAYEAKKWAFVSDYIRAYVLYNYGGIYIDTDILVLDNFDKLLNNKAFVGFENNEHPFTATFGCIKNHPLLKDILDYYDNLKDYSFNFNDNNTISVSDILINKYGCKIGNIEQTLKEDIKVYKDDILCNPSINSITIHIFTGTWLQNKKSLKYKIVKFFKLRLTTKKKAALYQKIFK